MNNLKFDAVLFDFTGVLTVSPAGAVMGPALEAGLTIETFLPIALGPLDTDGDHPWHKLERGEISFDTYVDELVPLCEEAGIEQVPMPPEPAAMLEAFTPIPEMVELVRRCGAAGYPTAIVTNNIKEWGAWRSAVNADDLVDVIIDSCQVGIRKPTPAIFGLALERLGGLSPERCLFVDDFPWNITGAEQAGLQTYQVTDPVEAATELATILEI